ncbi:MAG: class I SAM-dependent methyltransferase [Sphingobium sp.]
MDAVAYRSLRDLQDRHWWFVGRRKIIAKLITSLIPLQENPRILEAGCGYGGNLAMLGQFGDLDAFELEDEARAHAVALARLPVSCGSLPDQVGFENQSFDLIAMLDVLEHIDDDVGSLSALGQRLGTGGSILLTVPAIPWLWSEHDAIHHHKRRYTKASLEQVLQQAGFELVSIGYFNTLLFPLALVQRLASRLSGRGHSADGMPHRLLNSFLSTVFAFERNLLGRIKFPVGLSLYAVARLARP